MTEKQIVQPLSVDEIKDGVITKVCEALYEAMNKDCDLYGCAYSRFMADGEMRMTLDNFGTVRTIVVKFAIPYTPPNVFRRETGQAVPVVVKQDDGSIEQKAVFYKRERGIRIGRDDGSED